MAPTRTEEVVWSDAGVKFRGIIPAKRRWQKSPVTGESAKETVKTIAQGMPGDSGEPVVTTVCFLPLHTGRGRIGRPAFPASLLGSPASLSGSHCVPLVQGRTDRTNPDELRRGNVGACFDPSTSLRANGSRECAPEARSVHAVVVAS